ncbi:unnamed protein product [Rangifer tarandus platyrhynchus]|uniref:Uncharacterized protein n=1 Tax=Rangifer tarandus platyrhynchus TaxID=3082113 RepID=A0AC59YRH9_RANTA
MPYSSVNPHGIRHRAWHLFLMPLRRCQPERRGWVARVAAHVEQGSVAGGWSVWRRSADTRRAVGSGCYPESDGASARIRTEEQCLSAQQSREAPEALQSIMRGALSSFLSPKGLSGLSFLMGGEPWGPASFKNQACFQH